MHRRALLVEGERTASTWSTEGANVELACTRTDRTNGSAAKRRAASCAKTGFRGGWNPSLRRRSWSGAPRPSGRLARNGPGDAVRRDVADEAPRPLIDAARLCDPRRSAQRGEDLAASSICERTLHPTTRSRRSRWARLRQRRRALAATTRMRSDRFRADARAGATLPSSPARRRHGPRVANSADDSPPDAVR